MQLVTPSVLYQNSYLEAIEEGREETQLTKLDLPKKGESFPDFVKRLSEYAKGLQLPGGWIPSTELWLIDNNTFIGRVSIRHTLTDHLRQLGGHIGYYIRPSKRKMGYGKKILELGLLEAKKLGLENILITCDIDNIGSQKIITSQGGVLENTIEKTTRYWIKVK